MLDITHLAKLASLSLTAEEAEKLTHEIGTILQHVKQLEALDTSKVEPTTNVQMGTTSLREDAPEPSLSHEDALAQAPRAAHEGFAVPAFVES